MELRRALQQARVRSSPHFAALAARDCGQRRVTPRARQPASTQTEAGVREDCAHCVVSWRPTRQRRTSTASSLRNTQWATSSTPSVHRPPPQYSPDPRAAAQPLHKSARCARACSGRHARARARVRLQLDAAGSARSRSAYVPNAAARIRAAVQVRAERNDVSMAHAKLAQLEETLERRSAEGAQLSHAVQQVGRCTYQAPARTCACAASAQRAAERCMPGCRTRAALCRCGAGAAGRGRGGGGAEAREGRRVRREPEGRGPRRARRAGAFVSMGSTGRADSAHSGYSRAHGLAAHSFRPRLGRVGRGPGG